MSALRGPSKDTLIRHKVHWPLVLQFPSLQSFEQYLSVVCKLHRARCFLTVANRLSKTPDDPVATEKSCLGGGNQDWLKDANSKFTVNSFYI